MAALRALSGEAGPIGSLRACHHRDRRLVNLVYELCTTARAFHPAGMKQPVEVGVDALATCMEGPWNAAERRAVA